MMSPEGRSIRYVEGSPDDISKRGTEIKELGEKMLESAGVLDDIKNNSLAYGGQEGKAIDKLRESIGDSYETLHKAGELYKPVGPFISAYGDELAWLQPMIRTTVDDCDELWTAFINQPGDKDGSTEPEAGGSFLGMGGYDADSPEAQEEADNNQAAKEAYEAWKARAEDFDRHYDSWFDAFDAAEKGIGDEMAGSIEDSTWDNWSDFVSVLTEILSWAALIVGIVAIFAGGWILLAIGAALALGAFALTYLKYANGAASGWDLAFAALAIIPAGKITNLTKFAQLPKLMRGAGGAQNAMSRTWKALDTGPVAKFLSSKGAPLFKLNSGSQIAENVFGKGYRAARSTHISMYIGNRSALVDNLTNVRVLSAIDTTVSRLGAVSSHTGRVTTVFDTEWQMPPAVGVFI